MSELYAAIWGSKKAFLEPKNKNLELLVAILLLSVENLSEIETNAEENRIERWLDNIS